MKLYNKYFAKKIMSFPVGKKAYHIVFIYENYMISIFADRNWNYLFDSKLISKDKFVKKTSLFFIKQKFWTKFFLAICKKKLLV